MKKKINIILLSIIVVSSTGCAHTRFSADDFASGLCDLTNVIIETAIFIPETLFDILDDIVNMKPVKQPSTKPRQVKNYANTIPRIDGHIYLERGLKAYRSFDYKSSKDYLIKAIASRDLKRIEAGNACLYLGSILYLTRGLDRDVKAMFKRAKRLGVNEMHPYVFPPELIRLFKKVEM
ncbi:hypothetical protein KAW08_05315 [bacterium]|nr:hypothetical protein [bacterium]